MKSLENKIRKNASRLIRFISYYRAIVLTLLLILALVIGYLGRKSTFFTFPLDAGVWGTASDWTLVVVTGLTVYFLIKSFFAQSESNSIQNKTLIEQQKITEIEQFIFKEKVKPIFELEIGDHGIKIDESKEEATAIYSFNFYVYNASAKDIKIDYFLFDESSLSNKQIAESSRNELYPGTNFSTMPTEYQQKKSNKKASADYIFRFSFDIRYSDVLDNLYEQNIIFYSDSNGTINTHQGGPKPIQKQSDK